ncbi:MAG: hypothetical protein KC503_02230 [Myxococcales bacterium]|nr:hypothetical protein [Myxococcales bacterium]
MKKLELGARRVSALGALARVAVVAALVGLVGCSDYGQSAGAGYDIASRQYGVTKTCGVDRYLGPQGADVSYYQGNFNWAGRGLVFGYARISDGAPNTGFVDPKFDYNWKAMKANGVLRGAYQFFRPGQNATAQANFMVQKVGKLGATDMPAMIDVEATDGQSPATIAQKIKTWLSIVEKGTGKRPLIYTGSYFWEASVKDTTLGKYPLWIAAYGTTCPSVPKGWTNWTFWQYCNGQTKYCKNGQGFDRNVFNGTLAELKKLVGQGVEPYYGATYVNQSWPLATTALEMVPGQTIVAHITLENTGSATWNAKTRLGTSKPLDRKSAFADASWVAPNRAAAVSGSVKPGERFKFTFNLRAPEKLGDYHEYFGLVQEGVHWFGDAGQAGPPNDQIQAFIKVVRAEWAGKLVSATFGGAERNTPKITIELGSTVSGTITLENTGKQTWTAGSTKLAPTPRDADSPLADASWESPARVGTVSRDVAQGDSYSFPVTLYGATVGEYTQTFSLLQEGVTWFGDAPKGGGPADDVIKVQVVVIPAGGAQPDAGGDPDSGVPAGDSGSRGGGDVTIVRSSDGCSVGAGPAPRGPALLLVLLALARALGRRRQRRR